MQALAKKILIAITGASGMIFARSFLRLLQAAERTVDGICSEAGQQVLAHELAALPQELPGVSRWFSPDDLAAPPASGSSCYQAMVILPCTMGTLAAVASGQSRNLIHRAADVMLKERRPLLLATRETPFNRIHLENMLRAHDAGATICPPLPGFYLRPETLEEAADTFSWRLADMLGIDVAGRARWGE
ncbi:MAG: UbiX family flavin prenyltransferase [Desulfobulbaceae bacterium]|nr:UbiX family flavin prenyltransferase [Desulfobulbaceae bacterium]